MIRLAGALSIVLITSAALSAEPWNQFRGPSGTGISSEQGVPLEFGEDQNILWKTAIDGKAWSSPVVLGKQIWLTNAPADGKKLYAVCVDLDSGKIIHNRLVFDNPDPQFCIEMNSYATPTPFVEPGRVYVHFGAHGTACLDAKTAETLWQRRDLECNHHRGPASSPIIDGNKLIVHFDGFDQQYVVALDKTTGKTIWKTDRAFDFGTDNGDMKKAYGTPTIIEHNGRRQLISPCAIATEAFDPATGKLLWTVRHGGMNAAARPQYGQGLVFIVVGSGGMLAVEPDGKGDITGKVSWKSRKAVPKKSTPLLIDGLLFMVDDDGVASCREAATGKLVWQKRFKGEYAASPLLIDGRIYAFSRKGDITVFAPQRKFKLLAQNKLAAGFMATPAVADHSLILRTKTHLYRVGEK
jgi:outer membrane protein assembly factor BamB